MNPSASRRWDFWHELALLALIVMHLCWIVPVYRLLYWAAAGVSPMRAALFFGGLFLCANLLGRLLYAWPLKTWIRRGALAVFLILTLSLGLADLFYFRQAASLWGALRLFWRDVSDLGPRVPGEFAVILAILLIVQHSLELARDGIDPPMVKRGFMMGVGMLVFYGMVTPVAPGETPAASVYLFFAAALAALGASRLSAVGRLRGGLHIPLDRARLGSLAAAACGVIALALPLSWLLSSGPVYAFLMLAYNLAARMAVFLVAVLFTPFLYGFIFLLTQLKNLRLEIPALQFVFQQLKELTEALRDPNAPDPVQTFLNAKPLVLWGIVFLLVVAILRVARRYWKRRDPATGELQPLPVENLGGRLGDRLRELAEDLSLRLGLHRAESLLAAARIRRIYGQLLNLAAGLGHPRPGAQTPLEFLFTLEALLPGAAGDLALITGAYLRVRYGELPETMDEVRDVDLAWQRVAALGAEKNKKTAVIR